MTDYNNEKSLRITNLDPRVTEDALKGIFSLISPIVHIKITKDNSNVSIHHSPPPIRSTTLPNHSGFTWDL